MPAAARKSGKRKRPLTPLAEWLEAEGVSQQQLADEVGCTQSAIGMIAAGQRAPRRDLLSRLIRRTRLTAEQILGVKR